VLDSVTASAPPAPAAFIFINAVPPDVPIEVPGSSRAPDDSWTGDRNHSGHAHVEFAKVTIEEAVADPSAGGRSPVVEAVGGPLIYALEETRIARPLFVGFSTCSRTGLPVADRVPARALETACAGSHPAGLGSGELPVRRPGSRFLLPAPHGVTDR